MARPFKFTVDELRQKFIEYKEFRSTQYDIRHDCIKSGERAGETIEIKLPKPLTIISFCLFIGTTEKSFFNWLNNESENEDKELLQFITHVRDEIKDFQLSGASNGIYNMQIVARMNNLNETIKTENTNVETIVLNIESKKSDLQL